ncbi:hypothetical protein A4A32_02370 [Staphylococcus equorum]|uniref:hypothetical protein n=1 Tax=Staphylococcus equorum TaxID=246432 RepID=UPI0008FBAED4|nr:hypothetical protein [Staphylococcus equorum]OIS55198.1 hypothetical protein A4A32_02370 [Staphylococcus equorum]
MSIFDRLGNLKIEAEIKIIEGKDKIAQKTHEMRYGKWDIATMTKERKQSEKARLKRERAEQKVIEKEEREAKRQEERRLREIEEQKRKAEQDKRNAWIMTNQFGVVIDEENNQSINCPRCGTKDNVTAATWEVDEAKNSEDNGTYFQRTCNLCGHSHKMNKDNPEKIYK